MNEIKLINVGGVDQNIKDQYVRDIIAPSENGLDSSTNLPVSSRHYDEGDYLIAQDRKYYEAITDIDVGDTLVVGTNIRATTVTDEILMLKGQSANVAIETIADMETAATASKAFTTGKYVYWNYGVDYGMYEVIADIAEGDAFVTTGVSQNIELANKIGDDVSYLKKKVSKISNENLLDNPWFTINQCGETSYVGTTSGFVDRWRPTNNNTNTVMTVYEDGIEFKSGTGGTAFEQYIDYGYGKNLIGKTVTLSGLVKKVSGDGFSGVQLGYTDTEGGNYFSEFTIENGSGTDNTNDYVLVKTTFTIPSDAKFIFVRFRNSAALTIGKIKRIKLEIGSESTLLKDELPPRNFTEELERCQHWIVNLRPNKSTKYSIVGSGHSYANNDIYINIDLPVRLANNSVSFILEGPLMVYTPEGRFAVNAGTYTASLNSFDGNRVKMRIATQSPIGMTTAQTPIDVEFYNSTTAKFIVILTSTIPTLDV